MASPIRIRRARLRAALSQEQLATRVGVRRSAVSHWESESGKNPTVSHLRAIATATAVSFEWLATGRGAMVIDGESGHDVPAVALAIVEDDLEVALLEAFRKAPSRAQRAIVRMVEDVWTGKRVTRDE